MSFIYRLLVLAVCFSLTSSFDSIGISAFQQGHSSWVEPVLNLITFVHVLSSQQPGAVVVVQQPSGTQSSVLYTTNQYPAQGYPVQYPPHQHPQYPVVQVGQYPPPQYSAAPGEGGQPGEEAIPPKA